MLKVLIPILCLLPFWGHSQTNNILSNGSFEQYISCPTAYNQVTSHCAAWKAMRATSPDYYNGCAVLMGVPSNGVGYQAADHGQAYVGLVSTGQGIEYIWQEIPPLIKGAIYEVSFSVSLAEISYYAINGLSVLFFDTTNFSPTVNQWGPVSGVTPQVTYLNYGVITDTAGWTRFSALYEADSEYTFMALGGFVSNSSLQIVNTGYGTTYAYYYIDSVVMTLARDFGFHYDDTLLCTGDSVVVPFSVYTPSYYKTGNQFILQLSGSSGSFASPTNLDTVTTSVSDTLSAAIPSTLIPGDKYRIRIVSTNKVDSSFDNGKNISIGVSIPIKPVASSNGPVCSNDTLKLTTSSSGSGVSYKWTGPNNFTANIQSPQIVNPTLAASGDYIVVARSYGCMSDDTVSVTVINAAGPVSIQPGSNGPVCEGDTLKLTASTLTGTSYSWTGPNSFSSNQQNTVIPVTYMADSGNYVLSSTLNGCTSKDTLVVAVNRIPVFTATSNSPLCTGENLTFTPVSNYNNVSYNWSGSNGFNSTLQTPTLLGVFSVHTGQYYAKASRYGCEYLDTTSVYVKPLPDKPVATGDSVLCAMDTLELHATSNTSGVTYSWTGPNSFSSSQQNPTIPNTTTSTGGNYIVTVDLNNCIAKDTIGISVKPLPDKISLSSNTPVCAGDTLMLASTSSSAGVIYKWTGPNNFTSASQSVAIGNTTTSTTGQYVMSVDLNGCLYKDSLYAIVYSIPAKPVAGYNGPICLGENLKLAANNISGASYSWRGPGNYTASIQKPGINNVSYTDTGVYTVSVTINGCVSPADSISVSVNPLPFVTIQKDKDSSCPGQQVVFTPLPNNAGANPQYRWYVNNQLVFTGAGYKPTGLNDKDVVYCEMEESSKCTAPYKDTSNVVAMRVLPVISPSAVLVANPATEVKQGEYIHFSATAKDAGNNPAYQWKLNGKNIGGATADTWSANTLNNSDTVCVEVTSSYMCAQPSSILSNCFVVKISTAVTDINDHADLQLYPNPNRGVFTIAGVCVRQNVLQLVIVNTLGEIVYREEVSAVKGYIDKEIDISILPSGVYMVKLGSYVQRIIVNK